MADKDFIVKNGLVVNTDLIVADGSANRVGINNSSPDASLTVTGTANVSANVALGSALIVSGNTDIGGYVNIGSYVNVVSTANIGGNTAIRGTLTVNGAVIVSNTINVNSLGVSGNTSLVNVSAESISVNNINVYGSISGTFSANGNINPDVDNLFFIGNSSNRFASIRTVSLYSNGITSFGGDVSVTSNNQLFKTNNSISAISINSNGTNTNTVINGNNFVVLSVATFNSNVSVNNSISVSNGSISTSINNSIIQIGGGATINSTSFTGSSNNSTYLNNQPASYYTNATNLTTGTVPTARLPLASTIQVGAVQLVDSVSSTSITLSATANSVKTAYDTAITANNNAAAASSAAATASTKADTAYSNAVSYTNSGLALKANLSGATFTGTISPNANNVLLGGSTSRWSVFANTLNLSGDLTLSSASGILANGSLGSAGQVLHTNGLTTYWSTDDQGVTSVATGNGLTGGTITTTGTISVVGSNTIISNSSGIFVNNNTGLVANSTGLHVNSSYIAGITVSNATNALNLNGQPSSYYTNADNLSSGLVPYSRLSGTYNISIFGNAGTATTATTATKAITLAQAGTGTAMSFSYSGQSGQPSWLWGTNDGTNIFVWNPANFSVNYATSAGSATTATNSTQLNGQASSYYTNIPARLGYTPVNKAGDTMTGALGVSTTGSTGTAINGYGGASGYGVYGTSTSSYGIYGQSSNASSGGVIGWTQNGSYYGILGHTNTYSFYGLGVLYNSGEIRSTGNIIAYYSDKRLKKNIEEYTGWRTVIEGVKAYAFGWNENGQKLTGNSADFREVGFIAQEVQQAYPDGVEKQLPPPKELDVPFDENDPYLTVVKERMIPAHHEAIKYLLAKIEMLEAKLNEKGII